jgi:hypothetical protein
MKETQDKPEIQDAFETEISKPISNWLQEIETKKLNLPMRWIKFPKYTLTIYLNTAIEVLPVYAYVVKNDPSGNITVKSHYIQFLFLHISFNKHSLRK